MADNTSEKQQAIQQLDALLAKKQIPRIAYDRARDEIERVGEPAITKWLQQGDSLATPRVVENQAHIDASLSIIQEINERELEEAHENKVAYMTRATIMATLPRSKTTKLSFKRTSGDYTLLMHIPEELSSETGITLPYGTIPRLIFLWMSTEVILNKEQQLYLGQSRSDFMRKIGLQPRTGKRGNMKTFEQQMKGLLSTFFSAWRKQGDDQKGNLDIHHRTIASDASLWWDHNAGSESDALGGVILLDQKFYAEMLSAGIPVSLEAISQLKDSSMALDIYIWLTYRFHTLSKAQPFPWEWLFKQFGEHEFSDDETGRKNFKAYFKKHLKKVLEQYPEANAYPTKQGLFLHPSPTHVKLLKQ